MLTAAWASMAVSSGSGAAVATTPEGGSPTAPSSSEDVNPSPDAAIDILSTDGAPNEMLGARGTDQRNHPGTGRDVRCVRSKRSVGACPAERLLQVTLRSPRASAGGPLLEPERSARVAAEGANPFIKERRDRSEIMLIRPQQTHESSTNAASACRRPRH